MFIQTESTPNPATLKFIPGVTVLESGTASFTRETSVASPLAKVLFSIPEVSGIFFGTDFITVTKTEDSDWGLLKPAILTTIMEHFVSGAPVMLETGSASNSTDSSAENDSELVKQLKELIDTRVRPAVAQDGGDIVFHGFDENTGIVQLEMHGACSGCPSSTATLKNGIENMLKYYVPEVTAVEAV